MAENEDELEQLMEGWDDDLRIERMPDVTNLKIRSSACRNLLSLKSLCLKSIVNNMDNLWCKDFIDNWSGENAVFLLGPFDDLPGPLVTEVINALREMKMLYFRFILPLITCRLEVLDLSSVKGLSKVFMAIGYRCKDLLRVLNLEMCTGLSTTVWTDTLRNLRNLQVLNLRQTGVDDEVVGTIGSNISGIRELYLCNNDKVTNKGIQMLCIDDGHYGKCTKLSVLTVDFTSVDADGLLVALEKLPLLTVLDNNFLAEAVLEWHLRHLDDILHIQRMSFDFSKLMTEQLFEIVHVCPKLHMLTFLSSDGEDNYELTPFLNLSLLTSVTSQCSLVPSTPWIIQLGKSITHINLLGTCNDSEIDLSVIGHSCPNLIKLFIHEIKLTESDLSHQKDKYFRKLESASLQGNESYSFEKNLLSIFTSEHILSIKLILFPFHDTLLQKISEEAALDKNILANLNDLELWFCNQVSIRGLRHIICHAPCLKKLTVIRCESVTLADFNLLETFIKTNALDIHLSWT